MPGVNILYPRIEQYDINYVIYDSPSLTQFDGYVYPKIGVGFFTNLSFRKKIIYHQQNALFVNAGLGYKYSTVSLKYFGREDYYDGTVIQGNGEVEWKEHYFVPMLGINLFSNLSKKICIENGIIINYNFLINGKEKINFTGRKWESTGSAPDNYERHETIVYSRKSIFYPRAVTTRMFDIHYSISVGYLFSKNISIYPQIILPLSNFFLTTNIFKQKMYSIGYYKNPDFAREIYNQMAFSLSLNLSLK